MLASSTRHVSHMFPNSNRFNHIHTRTHMRHPIHPIHPIHTSVSVKNSNNDRFSTFTLPIYTSLTRMLLPSEKLTLVMTREEYENVIHDKETDTIALQFGHLTDPINAPQGFPKCGKLSKIGTIAHITSTEARSGGMTAVTFVGGCRFLVLSHVDTHRVFASFYNDEENPNIRDVELEMKEVVIELSRLCKMRYTDVKNTRLPDNVIEYLPQDWDTVVDTASDTEKNRQEMFSFAMKHPADAGYLKGVNPKALKVKA